MSNRQKKVCVDEVNCVRGPRYSGLDHPGQASKEVCLIYSAHSVAVAKSSLSYPMEWCEKGTTAEWLLPSRLWSLTPFNSASEEMPGTFRRKIRQEKGLQWHVHSICSLRKGKFILSHYFRGLSLCFLGFSLLVRASWWQEHVAQSGKQREDWGQVQPSTLPLLMPYFLQQGPTSSSLQNFPR